MYSTFHSQISGLGHCSGETATCHETGGKVHAHISAVLITVSGKWGTIRESAVYM